MSIMDSISSKRNLGWKKAFRPATKATETNSQTRRSSTQTHTISRGSNSLENKYGRPNKILSNEGAGGSILLVTRQRDNTTFAVKRFRRRHSIEDESTYVRQIMAEYYCGARLNHSNIIKTLDLFQEHGQFLQVMEYAPYCLFDRVMSRQMSTEEINCAFMQMLAGSNCMHRSGFAHRDLKLENVVITENGIMKLIDFGTATIVKQPGAKSATGKAFNPTLQKDKLTKTTPDFAGCLPYMAPEIPTNHAYDPQKADVWSLAIIYCCMVLGRFPWTSPDRSNEAFCLFAAMESPKTQLSAPNPPSRASSTKSVTVINVSITESADEKQRITEKVLGSWGLLRQLPAESRDVIKAMLSINASARPTLEQVMKMQWIAEAQSCSEDVDGILHAIDGHRHHS